MMTKYRIMQMNNLNQLCCIG